MGIFNTTRVQEKKTSRRQKNRELFEKVFLN